MTNTQQRNHDEQMHLLIAGEPGVKRLLQEWSFFAIGKRRKVATTLFDLSLQ